MKNLNLILIAAAFVSQASLADPVNPFDAFLGTYKVVATDCEVQTDNCTDKAFIIVEYITQNNGQARSLFITEVFKTGGTVSSPMFVQDDRDSRGQGTVSTFKSEAGMASFNSSKTFAGKNYLYVADFITASKAGITHRYCEFNHFWNYNIGQEAQSKSSRCFDLVKTQ